ncbi:MAG TPA: DUF6766 family protein [Patescibacteria group bacterium]|nr:DUF6766 family protein [Patescibacteria group bacterium]
MNISKSIFKRYGYAWVTAALFLISFVGHWLFAWPVYVSEQEEHGRPIEFSGFFHQTARDSLENWQSEFLQLLWQVAGLTYLLYLGSPQSKEGDDRKEAKLDAILAAVSPEQARELIENLDKKYPRG